MVSQRKKVVIAVFIVAITITSAFATLDYFYTHQTDYNGVYKITKDPYYSGKALPLPFNVTAFEYAFNQTGNFTAHYTLVGFPYTFWENRSFGQFEFGVTFGFYPNGSDNLIGIPFNSEVAPRIWIGLLSAHYNYSGFLGIKPISMTAYSSLPYVSPINYGNISNPQLWNMYTVEEYTNVTTRQVNIITFGDVYYIHPVNQLIGSSKALYTLHSGQYYLLLQLDLYRITPFRTQFLTGMNISEPWVHIT